MQRLAYLISRYPAISHTFILREVLELRRLGLDVEPASINPPDRPVAGLTSEERAESERTFFVKAQPLFALLKAILRTMWRNPGGVRAGVALAIRLGGFDLKALLLRACYLGEALVIGDWMQRRQLNHLHIHFATPAATVGLLVRTVFGYPFSLTVHGPDEFYSVHEYHLERKLERASFVCCIGSYCRSQLMKLSEPKYWDKFELAPLGVDPHHFQPAPNRRTEDSPFRILCVGRLVPAKGQAVLLSAVRLLCERNRTVELTFAGDGPDRARLEAMADQWSLRGVCHFLGTVKPDDVRDLYARTDAFILPSFAEGIPVVLMEAMAMSVPCISTVINGIPELIESGKHGLLVAPSDVHALCEAIERLMDDATLRHQLGVAGRAKVLTHYELATNVRQLAGIFRSRLRMAS